VVKGVDPKPDDAGYPTNPEYLNAIGFDPVEANRAIVDAQQLYAALADPQQRAAFLAEYDLQLAAMQQESGQQQQQPMQRPVMPGQAGYQTGDPGQALQRALKFGNPVDNWEQAGQVWGQVPAQYLIEQVLSTFPEVD
jgi:hypothetical protein